MTTMSASRIPVKNGIDIALLTRITRATNYLTIVFIHGFGCVKEDFFSAFTDPSLAKFDLVTLDLPGHGQSSKPEDFDYSMRNLARIVLEALETLAIGDFHLCGHSMGGLIGLEIAEQHPEIVRSFMNLEGNLTSEDCFITRKIIRHSFNEFAATARKSIEKELEYSVHAGFFPLSYLRSFKKTSSSALYHAALDTVAKSDDPNLINRFIGLKNQCYVYGRKNKEKFPSEQFLLRANIPVFYVDNAGHAMAEENPSALYILLKNWIIAVERSFPTNP
ncbi:MAG: alpha/beta fold hydrolase [Candidatus Hodarchaeota archaeon]